MARSRSQRRRRRVRLYVTAAVLTIGTITVAHDVTATAHQSRPVRSQLNENFAALAIAAIDECNLVDSGMANLLVTAKVTRALIDADAAQWSSDLTQCAQQASALAQPDVSNGLNRVMTRLVPSDVADERALLANLLQQLALPSPRRASTLPTVPAAETSLAENATTWQTATAGYATQPGGSSLPGLMNRSGAAYAAHVAELVARPSLILQRHFEISAIGISPATLPSRAGLLLLPPVGSMGLTVTVTNTALDNQSVTVSMALSPRGGAATTLHITRVLGPTSSYAFSTQWLAVRPGETAQLVVSATGPAGQGLARSRTYTVAVASRTAGI